MLVFGGLGTAITLVVTAWAVWPDSPGAGAPGASGWREVLSRNNLELVPERFSCEGVKDKVDLDTGKPGHGQQPQIPLCKADGDLADLIIDQTGLHTAGANLRNLLAANSGSPVTAELCDTMFNNPQMQVRTNVFIEELQAGDQLCVRTDKGKLARVTFARPPAETAPGIVINYVVWEKQT